MVGESNGPGSLCVQSQQASRDGIDGYVGDFVITLSQTNLPLAVTAATESLKQEFQFLQQTVRLTDRLRPVNEDEEQRLV
jgi:hypothetical protein